MLQVPIINLVVKRSTMARAREPTYRRPSTLASAQFNSGQCVPADQVGEAGVSLTD